MAYGFRDERTQEGKKYRLLKFVDEFTHECIAICIERKLKSIDVVDVRAGLFMTHGVREHVP